MFQVIRGVDGKKVEVIKSTKGYKKFKKKLDKFPHIVRRKTIYVQEGGKAQVTCVRFVRYWIIHGTFYFKKYTRTSNEISFEASSFSPFY